MNPEPKLIVASDLDIRLQTLEDIPNIIGACYGCDGLILSETDLPQDFFDLKTGFAGELFQKLSNYRIQTALVLANFAAYGERFGELAYEHKSHPLIRFLGSKEEAVAWLNGL